MEENIKTREREELAKRVNSTAKTLYNWETSKPELIKLLKLGLEKENEIKNGIKNENDIKKKIEELELRMNAIEIIKGLKDD